MMHTEKAIIDFIKDTVLDAKATGVVIGVSGGVDSAVVLALCAKALGPENIFALMLPSTNTPSKDLEDAVKLCEIFKIKRTKTIVIDNTLKTILNDVKDGAEYQKAVGNVQARIRMIYLYYYANSLNSLVVGTTDKSENLIGYFTKWGDGACDLEPIIHLTKSEVRTLGSLLGIPNDICYKPSSPCLWPGHQAEKELGVTYKDIDRILELNRFSEHKRKEIPHL